MTSLRSLLSMLTSGRAAAVLALAVAGCGGPVFDFRPRHDGTYKWGTWNHSTDRAVDSDTDVTYVRSDGKVVPVSSANMGPGGRKIISNMSDPIPEKVHAHLVTTTFYPHGHHVELGDEGPDPREVLDVDLNVRSVVPDDPPFDGTIWIVVTQTGVEIQAETKQQQEARETAEAREANCHVPTPVGK